MIVGRPGSGWNAPSIGDHGHADVARTGWSGFDRPRQRRVERLIDLSSARSGPSGDRRAASMTRSSDAPLDPRAACRQHRQDAVCSSWPIRPSDASPGGPSSPTSGTRSRRARRLSRAEGSPIDRTPSQCGAGRTRPEPGVRSGARVRSAVRRWSDESALARPLERASQAFVAHRPRRCFSDLSVRTAQVSIETCRVCSRQHCLPRDAAPSSRGRRPELTVNRRSSATARA